ncbi:ABC-type Mn/Zn transport system, permease component, fragment [Candidatus Phytoplasma mali]|uniref:ABC-type Mn/Zn transport system, permease component n=1 Tax=Phytoplasma mali (strain AT) TaxID=482235 RepID=B3R026_PHYMT|nr:metal ABC transporter permease [Candidatus Phytoplasma mali]CAP18190.1 ABC-type Mn/Zn transport system, permease component [Candidatus Phytoplasma mali]CAP18682.1 ABC-type Mn/Zn transport system, permease component, fragment [Candidatus Phytoplasma mali]
MFNIILIYPYFAIVSTSIACSILGSFLILKKKSMLVDAISHSVLLGIVGSVLYTKDLSSPLLIIGATLTGLLTAYLSELLSSNKKVNEDASIGIAFSFLFSIAVIIIGLNITGIKEAHVDVDAALLGDPNLVTLPRIFNILVVLFLNIIFVLVFYKELKIASFDKALASSLGFSVGLINYALITLVSLTTVVSFDAVGSILVIALMIGPAATALLFAKNLFHSVLLSILLAFLSAHIGYCLSILTDLPLSGLTSFITLVLFLLVLFFAPNNGIISKIFKYRFQKKIFFSISLLMHIQNHNKKQKKIDTEIIPLDLKWSLNFYKKCLNFLFEKKYIRFKGNYIFVTLKGKEFLYKKNEEFGVINN